MRKAGLWEMKMLRPGAPAPEMTMQHCTDETTDKAMSSSFSPASKDMCSKQDIQKTATGYVTNSVCTVAGVTMTIAFRDRRRFQLRLHRQGHLAQPGRFRRRAARFHHGIEAKWLGACKADQKPGDIMMPGGVKMNIKDMERAEGPDAQAAAK